ncbi:MAG: PA2779 family protein [Nitrospirota bacterium]
MKRMLGSFYAKPLAIYLTAALLAISTLAGPAEAMFMPAAGNAGVGGPGLPAVDRTADLNKIQTALESKALQQKLMDYGFSPDEAMAKINSLSDDQVHQLAANADSLQAGGDAVGAVVGLLIIALLVVLLIYLLEGRIEIKRR